MTVSDFVAIAGVFLAMATSVMIPLLVLRKNAAENKAKQAEAVEEETRKQQAVGEFNLQFLNKAIREERDQLVAELRRTREEAVAELRHARDESVAELRRTRDESAEEIAQLQRECLAEVATLTTQIESWRTEVGNLYRRLYLAGQSGPDP